MIKTKRQISNIVSICTLFAVIIMQSLRMSNFDFINHIGYQVNFLDVLVYIGLSMILVLVFFYIPSIVAIELSIRVCLPRVDMAFNEQIIRLSPVLMSKQNTYKRLNVIRC